MSFLEDYTLLDELGQGGYATVYKVRHNKLGYIRAIRVLQAVIATGEDDPTYQKFLDECRILLRLGNGSHPNIVHIYQPLLRGQRAIVEMDYVKGDDLTKYLTKNSSFVEASDVMKLIHDIGSALAYCHEDIYKYCMSIDEDGLTVDNEDASQIKLDDATRRRLIEKYRVIHNDIHSGNIIRRDDGIYVILDFGLAVEGNNVIRSSRRHNGAPEFKAPEKWDNDKDLSTESDVYSFGVVMYEFLTGRVPFVFDKNNPNVVEAEYLLSKAHKNQKPDSIFELRKAAFEKAFPGETYIRDYPEWLDDVIMKCLTKDPKDRYRDGKELYLEIQKHSEEEKPVPVITVNRAPAVTAPPPIWSRPQDNDAHETLKRKLEETDNELARARQQLYGRDREIADLRKEIAAKPLRPGTGKWKGTAIFMIILVIALCAGAAFLGERYYQQEADLAHQMIVTDSLEQVIEQKSAVKQLKKQVLDRDESLRAFRYRVDSLQRIINDNEMRRETDAENSDEDMLRRKIDELSSQSEIDKATIAELEAQLKNMLKNLPSGQD